VIKFINNFWYTPGTPVSTPNKFDQQLVDAICSKKR
jgi:hypothetical protein